MTDKAHALLRMYNRLACRFFNLFILINFFLLSANMLVPSTTLLVQSWGPRRRTVADLWISSGAPLLFFYSHHPLIGCFWLKGILFFEPADKKKIFWWRLNIRKWGKEGGEKGEKGIGDWQRQHIPRDEIWGCSQEMGREEPAWPGMAQQAQIVLM